jgi:hypothetical protein
VIEHAIKGHLEELRAAQEARKDRLAAAREKERKLRAVNGYGAFKGPAKLSRATRRRREIRPIKETTSSYPRTRRTTARMRGCTSPQRSGSSWRSE